MLRLIPAPLHRLLYRTAHSFRKVWWRFRKPQVAGCRVLALDEQNRVLLIRHSYGSRAWMPPGGGLARGEEAVAGAAREFLEETGCALLAASQVALVTERLHGAGNVVHVIVGTVQGAPQVDYREIVAAQFFALDALPEDMPVWLRAALPDWIGAWKVDL